MNASQYLQTIKHKIDREYLLSMNSNKGAVIVETRQIKDFGLIVKNHLHFLPPNYGLTVFHSNKNINFVQNELEDIAGVNYVNTGDSHLNEAAYNYMLTSEWFWKLVPYQKALIFQVDSLLLRSGIEVFEKYDYVGACWKHINKQVGNGGLSLRTNELMRQIIKKFPYNPVYHGNEDVFFSNNIESFGGIKPSCEVANYFSIETIFSLGSLGVHAISRYLSASDCSKIFNQYEKWQE